MGAYTPYVAAHRKLRISYTIDGSFILRPFCVLPVGVRHAQLILGHRGGGNTVEEVYAVPETVCRLIVPV